MAGGEAHLLQQAALDERQQLPLRVQVVRQPVRAHAVDLQPHALLRQQPRLRQEPRVSVCIIM